MPPIRTQESNQPSEGPSKSKSTYKHNPPKHRTCVEKSNAVPGVQKIKAALRQTRRLLAKDKLAANVRVETERRLKTLEVELHAAEVAKKERTFAVRYHKVKFFERQKVIRKIKQAQNRLEQAEGKSHKKINAEVQELRVDLNYILHYPKLKKYISLFPPEERKDKGASAQSQAEAQKASTEREEIRTWIRQEMEHGELPAEPENTIGAQDGNGRTRTPKWPSKSEDSKVKSKGASTEDQEQDEFFGEDEESGDNSS